MESLLNNVNASINRSVSMIASPLSEETAAVTMATTGTLGRKESLRRVDMEADTFWEMKAIKPGDLPIHKGRAAFSGKFCYYFKKKSCILLLPA